MKTIFIFQLTRLSLLLFLAFAFSVSAADLTYPVKYLGSCEIDINVDGKDDVVLLMETQHGRELVALLTSENSYTSFLVYRGKTDYHLRCMAGPSVKDSRSAKQPKVVKTPGTYLVLKKPESGAVAFIWEKNRFTEVPIEE